MASFCRCWCCCCCSYLACDIDRVNQFCCTFVGNTWRRKQKWHCILSALGEIMTWTAGTCNDDVSRNDHLVLIAIARAVAQHQQLFEMSSANYELTVSRCASLNFLVKNSGGSSSTLVLEQRYFAVARRIAVSREIRIKHVLMGRRHSSQLSCCWASFLFADENPEAAPGTTYEIGTLDFLYTSYSTSLWKLFLHTSRFILQEINSPRWGGVGWNGARPAVYSDKKCMNELIVLLHFCYLDFIEVLMWPLNDTHDDETVVSPTERSNKHQLANVLLGMQCFFALYCFVTTVIFSWTITGLTHRGTPASQLREMKAHNLWFCQWITVNFAIPVFDILFKTLQLQMAVLFRPAMEVVALLQTFLNILHWYDCAF